MIDIYSLNVNLTYSSNLERCALKVLKYIRDNGCDGRFNFSSIQTICTFGEDEICSKLYRYDDPNRIIEHLLDHQLVSDQTPYTSHRLTNKGMVLLEELEGWRFLFKSAMMGFKSILKEIVKTLFYSSALSVILLGTII